MVKKLFDNLLDMIVAQINKQINGFFSEQKSFGENAKRVKV